MEHLTRGSFFDPEVVVGETTVTIPRTCNQVTELVKYAYAMIYPDELRIRWNITSFGEVEETEVFNRLKLFHTDSVICGLSAIALRTRAPCLLRQEALEEKLYLRGEQKRHGGIGARLFGSASRVPVAKAVAANCAAVREWDSNGTVFGFHQSDASRQAGEFGHNDYYPIVIAAAHHMSGCANAEISGRTCLRAMLVLDEIRGRLAEVFPLKDFKIDHVLHGGIASSIVYGVLLRTSVAAVESAVGMLVSHYTPWRAIRAGEQLSDSKGASAALISEAAVNCVHRAIRGFRGPADIFRNPASPFRVFVASKDKESPFDLSLTHSGSDFAVMGMHFKLGLYEHQSAGALDGLLTLLLSKPELLEPAVTIQEIVVRIYKTAADIIGDAAKRHPKTRQSADHSMMYILARTLAKARGLRGRGLSVPKNIIEAWTVLMLLPHDYSPDAIENPDTQRLINVIRVEKGGSEFDKLYPQGIPTQLEVTYSGCVPFTEPTTITSPLVLHPLGHAALLQHRGIDTFEVLAHKHAILGRFALDENSLTELIRRLQSLENATAEELESIYMSSIRSSSTSFELDERWPRQS